MGQAGGGGLEHGEQLVRFGEAITRGNEDADEARSALRAVLGEHGFLEAAGIVGIFNGLVRTADLSGIPIDEGTLHGSASFVQDLGLDDFAGAANTDLERADPTAERGHLLGAIETS
ncbi:MAG: hypothetical protein GY725_23980 [bacterium]|nr:hypothetical protein [bacterium]